MHRKMKCYLFLLIVLWSGVFAESLANEMKEHKNIIAIEAVQNNSDDTQLLHERNVSGEISLLEKELEAGELLTAYQGEMVKSLYGENFYCFYGYTDKIKNYVIADGEKVNLNLVITYDEVKDVTHIIWATPFYNEVF